MGEDARYPTTANRGRIHLCFSYSSKGNFTPESCCYILEYIKNTNRFLKCYNCTHKREKSDQFMVNLLLYEIK